MWGNPYKVSEQMAQTYSSGQDQTTTIDDRGGQLLLCHCRQGPCHADAIIELLR